MFIYEITGNTELKIHTPFVKNYDDIKNDVVQTANYTNNISRYPNGAVLELHQYSNKIIINSNVELIANPDGSYTLPE